MGFTYISISISVSNFSYKKSQYISFFNVLESVVCRCYHIHILKHVMLTFRYIELFRNTMMEVRQQSGGGYGPPSGGPPGGRDGRRPMRPGPYERPDRYGGGGGGYGGGGRGGGYDPYSGGPNRDRYGGGPPAGRFKGEYI